MRRNAEDLRINEREMSAIEFMESYNKNMPVTFPRASAVLMRKFREDHSGLFRHGDLWSLDQHRKRLMDWLPKNNNL